MSKTNWRDGMIVETLNLSVNAKGRKCLFSQLELLKKYNLMDTLKKFDESILIFLFVFKAIKELQVEVNNESDNKLPRM